MLITQGPDRSALTDQKLAISLAAIAGGLNAAAFYAVGFFSANMTGNVSALSDHIATGALGAAWLYLAIVLAFVLGAAVSGVLVFEGERRQMSGVHAYAVVLEGLLIAPLALVDVYFGNGLRVPLLAIGLAFLMGFQNAIVTHISSARVRTTHVSGMATDLGIEMAMAWYRRGIEDAAATANASRLRLHLTTMLAFLAGGVGGVMLYRMMGGYGFLIASCILCLVGARGISSARKRINAMQQ